MGIRKEPLSWLRAMQLGSQVSRAVFKNVTHPTQTRDHLKEGPILLMRWAELWRSLGMNCACLAMSSAC